MTGYPFGSVSDSTPAKQPTLVLKRTDFIADPPTFKYRGFFHDDEDILPRPFDENGYPLQTGTVPAAIAWAKRLECCRTSFVVSNSNCFFNPQSSMF